MTSATPGLTAWTTPTTPAGSSCASRSTAGTSPGSGHEHRQELTRGGSLAHDEVAQPAAARALVVRLEPLLPRPALERPANVVGGVGDDVAVVDGDQPVPAAELMEAERRAVGPCDHEYSTLLR